MTTSKRNGSGLGRFNGAAPALMRHVIFVLGGLIAGVFAMGLLYADVLATGKKADGNRASVEAIKESINEMIVEQKVLIQRFDDEKEDNREFRDRTSNALERILERLPRRERPLR